MKYKPLMPSTKIFITKDFSNYFNNAVNKLDRLLVSMSDSEMKKFVDDTKYKYYITYLTKNN